ncbi:MAG TPA: potassium-transporting ATPase subunit KdpC, partial [Alphaproteobacteria bacterium]|nr:potassium-transporting ATPase subunit KdpC [Alphaproteobacteria bacterium]
MFRELRANVTLFILLMAVTGVAYPWFMLNAGQTVFPVQASGSLVKDGDKMIGSSLIGQNFAGAGYFHPRPSAANYDASNSSGSNLGPASPELLKAVGDRATALKQNVTLSTPVDLVTSSASGLDPDISPAAARFQAPRVAEARHIDTAKLQELISMHIQPRSMGFIGENRVNVLELNRALDQLASPSPSSP